MYKIGLKLKDDLISNDKKIANNIKSIFITCNGREMRDIWFKYLME